MSNTAHSRRVFDFIFLEWGLKVNFVYDFVPTNFQILKINLNLIINRVLQLKTLSGIN